MPETLIFYLLSGLAIVTSVLVIGQRNPMYSVMLLIASFGALADDQRRRDNRQAREQIEDQRLRH